MSKDNQYMNNGNNNDMNENKDLDQQHISQSTDLADEQRVKILSPSMLVFRRFIRNHLAVVGIFFILAMFLFSFLGGALMPYAESDQFYRLDPMPREYAGVVDNTESREYRYTVDENSSFNSSARSRFILALNGGNDTFTYADETFAIQSFSETAHAIMSAQGFASAVALPIGVIVSPIEEGQELDADFTAAFTEAINNGDDSFEFDGETYSVNGEGREYTANQFTPVAVASHNVVAFDERDSDRSVAFHAAAELALMETAVGESTSFTANDVEYTLVHDEEKNALIYEGEANDNTYAILSPIIVNEISPEVHIDLEFRARIVEAIDNTESVFFYDAGTGEEEYRLERSNFRFTVRNIRNVRILDTYKSPDSENWLGTDGNGMDLMTRLMYGGRVSLTIGFIVVAISLIIGVTLGGVAGYFGGWIDNIIMRLVDVFYCIPSYPIIIILGAFMDAERVSSQTRMMFLMLLLGLLGWSGIARMVRGQILSLREQEFMVATEATGISVSRRIFRHLIPNVIPQLIVIATQSLGGTILTEATLSFLGLGVKYPFASWGNIINAVSTVHVMTSYWFVWIPAGVCIMITVLGFNFIGDGLRDAFDPKMKR